MSIQRKIWGLVALVLVTCLLLVGSGVTGLTSLHKGMSVVTDEALPDLQLASEVRILYLTMHATAFGRAVNTDPARGKQLDEELHRYDEEIIARVAALRKHIVDPAEVAVLDEANAAISLYLRDMKRVGSLASMGENKMALDIMNDALRKDHERAAAAFEKVGQLANERVAQLSTNADSVFRRSLVLSVSFAVICIGIFAVVGYFLARSITLPMAAMQSAITRTARELDFTRPVDGASNDEIGMTVSAYNELLKRLRENFGEVKQAAQQLSDAAVRVDGSSREIADNSRSQSDATASMAAAIEQLTVSIALITERATDASMQTQNSQRSADHGTEVIMSTVAGIQSIADSVTTASDRIAALRSDSESISSVANMIKEIADQTNLLALNAAIEAARAGEQGRGFAVVADEVRKLAERTTLATTDISTLILKIQDAARNAVDSMASSVEAVQRGVDNAQEAGSAIREIQSGASVLVEVVDEMTAAMREQNAASTMISKQIEQIAQTTERNSDAAQNVARALESISGMGRNISQTLSVYRV